MKPHKNVVFPIAITCFLVLTVSLVNNFLLKKEGFSKKNFLKSKDFDPVLEKVPSQQFHALKTEITDPEFKTLEPSRNLFTEKVIVKEEPLFTLKKVENVKIPIIFKGSIVRGDDLVIAQINLDNRTFFPKPGESIQGWQVLEIDKDKVTVKDPSGATSVLLLNQSAVSQKRQAWLIFNRTGQEYQVKEGEEILGYKVLDIQSDYVTLSNNQSSIRIQKEE